MSKTIKTIEELVQHFLKLNVNEHTETKNGLTYLSWAWAWQEVLKVCPTASYELLKFTNKETGTVQPYVTDPVYGVMVFTKVTLLGDTKEMWLPVMDGANKAMKDNPYTYKTKYGEKTVAAATMFDINKAAMRCLVKNLSMFGLGSYIYSGEDLPETEAIEDAKKKAEEAAKKTKERLEKKTSTKSSKAKEDKPIPISVNHQGAVG